MSDCSNCPSKESCASQGTNTCPSTNISLKVLPKYGNVKNIIGVKYNSSSLIALKHKLFLFF